MCALAERPAAGAEVAVVRRLLLAALPLKSSQSIRLIEALVESGGLLRDAQGFAIGIEMGSRFRVARVLRRESLPQLEELAAWVRVLRWLVLGQLRGGSLSQIALDDRLETSVCCRTIRRVTGATWTEARERGPEWALVLLIERCRSLAEASGARWDGVERTG
jgi:hypothetical protein